MGTIIGGQGRGHNMRDPNFVSNFCAVLVNALFLTGMSSESVRKDIKAALDKLKESEPDFHYEIEMPPHPKYNASTVIMEPFDLPRDEYILESVLTQYRAVTGR